MDALNEDDGKMGGQWWVEFFRENAGGKGDVVLGFLVYTPVNEHIAMAKWTRIEDVFLIENGIFQVYWRVYCLVPPPNPGSQGKSHH